MKLLPKIKANVKMIFLLVETTLFFALVIGMFSFSFAGVGQNVTVQTQLEIGNVYPEVLLVRTNEGSAINLVANQSRTVSCVGVLRDYNDDTDITSASAVLFDTASSSLGAADDNNKHYTNASCSINASFGTYSTYTDDTYLALANCTFDVWYYANPSTWNCTVTVNDTVNTQGVNSSSQTINQLLSVLLPSAINYGLVNATSVSDEQIANVTNVGNVQLNLTLESYAVNQHDGFAMNCSYGATKNISSMYEKYNLTSSTPGNIASLSQFEQTYVNTSTNPVTKAFRLPFRQNDSAQFLDETNSTYWRIYVPRGVAGNCTGNILFGATTATGS